MSSSYTIYRNNPGSFFGESFYDWRAHAFQELATHLESLGMRINIEDRESFELCLTPSDRPTLTILDSIAIIQDDQSQRYHVLDCHDMVRTAELELLVRDPRCETVLKCQYTDRAFAHPVYRKVKPWTYFDRFWPQNEQRLVSARQNPRTCNSLYFRGADWGDRGRILTELSRRGVINSDFHIIDSDDYFQESTRYRVMLSLPGYADICNRDIECFGSGTCILRPRLHTRFHNELIPNYHYISVETRCRNIDPVEVADRIEERFNEIAGDHEHMASVVENAARWYDDNVRRDPAMRLTARLLGLSQPVAPRSSRLRAPSPRHR